METLIRVHLYSPLFVNKSLSDWYETPYETRAEIDFNQSVASYFYDIFLLQILTHILSYRLASLFPRATEHFSFVAVFAYLHCFKLLQ